MGLCCLIFACHNLCACLCGCGAKFFDLQFPTMKFQSLRNISVVFAAALVLLSPRVWADADVSGGGALFEKMPIYWSPKARTPLREVYHDLILLRKQYAALINSRVDWLHNSDEARLLTFLRADDKDKLLIVINFSNNPFNGMVDLKSADGFKPVEIAGLQSSDSGPLPKLHLNGFEWRIYHRSPMLIHPVADLATGKD